MVEFTNVINQFGKMGEKTGWVYVDIPTDIAQKIKPNCRKSFRVKGFLDKTPIRGIALIPMGGGNFIMSLNAPLRKKLGKQTGALIKLNLEEDTEFEITIPEDLHDCLSDDSDAIQKFTSMTKSHQNYFINWINSAKTIDTRAKRIGLTVNAMLMGFNYGEMMRYEKAKKG